MKRWFRLKGFVILSLVISLIIHTGVAANTDAVSKGVLDSNKEQLTGLEKVAENSNLELYANGTNGEVAVRVKQSGYVWRSNPSDIAEEKVAKGEALNVMNSQILLTYSAGFNQKTVSSFAESVKKGGLKSEKIQKGVKFFYYFKMGDKVVDGQGRETQPEVGYTIPVQYTLEKDYMKAEILVQDIAPKQVTRREKVIEKIEGDQHYNIIKIDFLPYFGAAAQKDYGYMFIPEGSGALINFNNGKTTYDSYYAPIYGTYKDNPVLSSFANNNVKMPVFGIKKSENALFAVVDENESVGFITANVGGKISSYNNVYSVFQYRTVETNVAEEFGQPQSPVLAPKGNYGIRYYFLTGEEADYSGMARRYQKYLVDEKGLKKMGDADEGSICLEVYGGVQKRRSVLGIPTTVLEPLTTYKDLKHISEELKAKGVDNIIIKYKEWVEDKERGKIPTSVEFDSKLGSKGDFKNFINYAKDNGIGFFPSVNLVNFSKAGNGFFPLFNAAKSPNQAPAYQTQRNIALANFSSAFGRRWLFLKPRDVVKAYEKYYKSYSEYGNSGIALESIGDTVYSDNSKNGVRRGETTSLWTDIFKDIKSKSGQIMVDSANAYAFPYADHINNAPLPEISEELSDETVPFYQMVLHGYVSYSTSPVNLDSDPQKIFLKAVETGSNISYAAFRSSSSIVMDSYLNNLFSCNLDTWMETMTDQYKKVSELNKKIADKKIISHRNIENGVSETLYENNVRVIVNYNKQSINVSGKNISGESFAILEK